MKVYCNPLNLSYKYQHMPDKGYNTFREGADPTLISFKGRYYMFVSMSAGFWHSDDLVRWEFHEFINEITNDYAPDVRQVGEYIYLTASRAGKNCPVFRTEDPLSGKWELVSCTFAFWDPDMFCDDDGRVYFYWGCSDKDPIWGVELDPKDMTPKGDKKILVTGNPDKFGYERKGADRPWIEGAFMNKHNGKYYLQYACPGTELNTYSDGVYVSDYPLGPFTPQQSNPFSSCPGGFITGAGHGSTIQDRYGNWWHAATMRISVNHMFERRVGLFPAGFDEDGTLYCNQNFADYPIVVPDGKFDPRTLQLKWMLLSYKKTAVSSSSLAGHGPENALNENIRSWWCADTNKPGEWLMADLGGEYCFHAVQINFADEGIPPLNNIGVGSCEASDFASRYIDTGSKVTQYLLEGSVDGTEWFILEDKSSSDTDLPHNLCLFENGRNARYIRITAFKLPYDQRFALSGLRVFGIGKGEKPSQAQVRYARYEGGQDIKIKWDSVANAQGYNIRYGNAPDRLYHSWLVYDQNEINLSTVIKDETYYICVDSFNENGITAGETIRVWQYN